MSILNWEEENNYKEPYKPKERYVPKDEEEQFKELNNHDKCHCHSGWLK